MTEKSLFKELTQTGFHSSILTTYSVDAAFYDGSLHHRLRAYGSDNNILLADNAMLQRAISETPEAFTRAGTAYALVPVALNGAFHPKINLRLGSDDGCLIVGSANATAAGWGRNREIFGKFDWWTKRSDGNEAAYQQLIRKAYDYVSHWLRSSGLEAINRKLSIIERDAPWLLDVEANDEPLTLADGTLVDLLCEDGKGGPGILNKMSDLVGNAKVTRLVVLSPYWDARLERLLELIATFAPDEVVIALSEQKPEFPIEQLHRIPDVKFVGVFDGNDGGRFIHAKALIVETAEYDHVLFGSANCSDDALGLRQKPARNAECSVYRRVPAGQALELIGFDLSSPISRESLQMPTREQVEARAELSVPAGVIEASERNLRWTPSRRIKAPAGAYLSIPEGEFPFLRGRGETYQLQLPTRPRYLLIARVRLADGTVTSPVIVNDEVSLAQAAPGLGDKRLKAAFAKIELEGGDFLELASLAAIIFSDTQASKKRLAKKLQPKAKRHASDKADEPEAIALDYESPEAFRAAMLDQEPANGDSHRLNFDDPDAVNLLRIIMRGIGQHEEPVNEGQLFAAESEQPGDKEGNTGGDIVGSGEELGPPPPLKERSRREPVSREHAEKQTLDIQRAVTVFDKHLAELKEEKTPPPRKLTAETCFILRLMVEACRRPLQIKDGEDLDELFALDLVPKPHDRERSFPVRVGKILNCLWVGTRTTPSLLSRISIDRHQTEVPYDIFATIASTRWALARSVMAMASAGPKQDQLASMITRGALEIWRATNAWPAINAEAELEFAAKMDAAMGLDADETDLLLGHYRRLRDQLRAA